MPTGRVPVEPPVEIDIILAHQDHGIGIIEVKGYVPEIVNGEWLSPYGPTGSGGATSQLRRNRYALRDFLQTSVPEAGRLHIDAAIAFVNASGTKSNSQPTDITEDQLIWSDDLETIDHSVMRFMRRGRQGRPMYDDDVFSKIITAIRPNVEFDAAPGAYTGWARERIENYTAAQTRVVERLDGNRRVFVSGGAGTGKSRVALAWARRAAIRDDRVLLACFNEPLGAEMARRVSDIDNVMAGPFLRLALGLPGIPHLEVPDDANSDFWDNDVQGHLHRHWPQVSVRFDTIVIDEAQDFSPAWLAMLEWLLDPDGPRRMLLAGDADQELHQRGFVVPRPEDGWTLCELSSNTRNSLGIARILRQRLHGPPAPAALPRSTHIHFSAVTETDELIALVRAEALRLKGEGFTTRDIAVVCLDSAIRDSLRAVSEFVSFEEAVSGGVVCETARRLKGLEYGAVILCASRWPINDTVLYVGVSRAVFGLSVFGPVELGERLGLSAD